jgi:hypothetical protein
MEVEGLALGERMGEVEEGVAERVEMKAVGEVGVEVLGSCG